ncbi:MAG: DUF4149 domain-containing protein [Acidobacteriia bacterium]|nr:DUF4149 domain-containing protein [Terriglobia bacterium]
MSTFLRSIEFLCLSLWLGGDVFLSFVVAPGAFAVLPGRDVAGSMVGYALGRLHIWAMVCGVIFLVARVIRTRSLGSLVAPVAVVVVLMLALTAYSQLGVSARLGRLRAEMGSVQSTPVESPLRREFDRLHRVSVMIESGVLLSGMAAVYFLAREMAARP